MPLRSDWSEANCPIARTLDVVGDPWVLLILREAFRGSTRFEQFRDRLAIADNVLSRRLAGMVSAGLLGRTPYQGVQRRHEGYVLTQAGADLMPVLNALAQWGAKHTVPPATGGHVDVVHLVCGGTTDSSDTCTHCGRQLTPGEVAWSRSWIDETPTALAGAQA